MLVRARVRVRGTRSSRSLMALVDTGARMSVLDKELAEELGVNYTGRELSFISISGHRLRASEAVVLEFEVDGELLRYEAVAVADLPEAVKAALRSSGLDERLVVGLLTLERANMVPDATRGLLRRVEAFIF
ncbi:hypothetical protein DRO33_04965 [Candidatus Bathyarchaeota archaeon]|nr:MAG: hypothetical protein DRO33_04965 [Candidatus Bathyarchaeota archaeon]